MNSLIYHEVLPQNSQENYTQFNTIDFEILTDGRKLNPNSIRLDFELQVESAAGVLTDDKKIGIDHKIGAHSFFESFQVTTQSAGLLENLQEYPRYVSLVSAATMDVSEYCSAAHQAEGRQLTVEAARAVCEQVSNHTDDSAAHLKNKSFSLKPLICLNRMMGDGYSFSKNGFIKVSMNLARNGHALYGPEVDANVSYRLSNVRLRYTTRPDDGSQGKMLMNSYVSVKATSNSTHYNLDTRVPSKAVNGCILSFLENSKESDLTSNTYALERYPQVDELTFRFNDATNKYITYSITDQGDMVHKGIRALSDGDMVQANVRQLQANSGYLIGLPFESYVDLSQQKFSIEIKSASDKLSAQPRLVFAYFLCLISL